MARRGKKIDDATSRWMREGLKRAEAIFDEDAEREADEWPGPFKAVSNDPINRSAKGVDPVLGFDVEGTSPAEQGQFSDSRMARFIEWCNPETMYQHLWHLTSYYRDLNGLREKLDNCADAFSKLRKGYHDKDRECTNLHRKIRRLEKELDEASKERQSVGS